MITDGREEGKIDVRDAMKYHAASMSAYTESLVREFLLG